jgi:copper chaperone CopZ
MNRLELHIPAISCGHCVHTIQTELSELPGVQSVQGDPQTKHVIITFEAPATQQAIIALLNEIHYPPQEITA